MPKDAEMPSALSDTESLSKGVFSFKGKKKKPQLEDIISKANNEFNIDDKQTCTGDQLDHFNRVKTHIRGSAQNVMKAMFENLITNIIKYIHVSNERIKNQHVEEISAAALITGVNTPDHDILFSTLRSNILQSVTPHTILLNSKSCPSYKHLMNSISSQLIDKSGGTIPNPCTLTHIKDWYIKINKTVSSPTKKSPRKKSQTSSKPCTGPIVMIFEDFTKCPANVVQDLLLSWRAHLQAMPVIMVFGVSLSLQALRSTLTHHVSTMLSIESFQLTHSSAFLSALLDKLLMKSDVEFRLGSRPLQLLLDNFLCHDFSIQKMIDGIELCAIEHCLLSGLTFSVLHGSDLSSHRQFIRTLPSYKNSIEDTTQGSPSKRRKSVDMELSTIRTYINNIQTYHQSQHVYLEILQIIFSDLDHLCQLGKQVRQLYSNLLLESFLEKLDAAFKILENISRTDILVKLTNCLTILSENKLKPDEVKQLEQTKYKLEHFDELLAEQKSVDPEEPTNTKLPKKMKLHNLRAVLQLTKPRDVTLYENIRSEAIAALSSLFKRELRHYKSLPLYELWYYDDCDKILKQSINAQPRAVISTSLSKPHLYLKSVSKPEKEEFINPSLPDSSILFKLHLECGVMINLFDWMQAFISTHETANDKQNKSTTRELCARFTHSAAELQLLGFIKSTKRKTDHVTRATWGTM